MAINTASLYDYPVIWPIDWRVPLKKQEKLRHNILNMSLYAGQTKKRRINMPTCPNCQHINGVEVAMCAGCGLPIHSDIYGGRTAYVVERRNAVIGGLGTIGTITVVMGWIVGIGACITAANVSPQSGNADLGMLFVASGVAAILAGHITRALLSAAAEILKSLARIEINQINR